MEFKIQKIGNPNCTRPFVKYPQPGGSRSIEIRQPATTTLPVVSIIIPTMGSTRARHLQNLITQLKAQTFQAYEIILVIGDNRQGRAINCGAALARGRYLLILDDDTRLGISDLIEKMVKLTAEHPEIGMAGVANVVPTDASRFVRQVMQQIPRRTSPIVNTITDSDLAEHPCCLIPKAVFYQVGGENELIPRGLDPYLRQEIRQAGYRVVVLPELYIHHLPPETFSKFVRQFFRNGKMAAYVNKFYPQFLVELSTEHSQAVPPARTWLNRSRSYVLRLVKTLLTGKFLFWLSSILYLIGFGIGYLTLRQDDV